MTRAAGRGVLAWGRYLAKWFVRTPVREQLTTLRALFVLAGVEVAIRRVSLPRLSRALGVPLALGPPTAADGDADDELVPEVTRALRSAARVTRAWPFCAGPCLRRALVGGRLTRRFDPAIRIGVAAGPDDTVLAHAWLELGGRPLEDVDGFEPFQYSPVGGDIAAPVSVAR